MLDRILSAIGRFNYRRRYLVAILFAVFFIGVAIVQSFSNISYSYAEYNKVTEYFPDSDMLVIVYENRDEDAMREVVAALSENEHVVSLNAYSNTLGLEMSAAELASVAGIDESFIKTLFYIKENGIATNGMTVVELIDFLASDVFMNNEMFASAMDEESKAQLLQAKGLVDAIVSGEQYDAASLAGLFGLDENTVSVIFFLQSVQTMSVETFVNTMIGMAQRYPNVVPQEQLAGLQMLSDLVDVVKGGATMTPEQLVDAFLVCVTSLFKLLVIGKNLCCYNKIVGSCVGLARNSCFVNVRQALDLSLKLFWINVLTILGNDNVLGSTSNVQETILIEVTKVTC